MITGRSHTDTRSYIRTICTSKVRKAGLLEGLGGVGRLSGRNLLLVSFSGAFCLVGCNSSTMSSTSSPYYEYSHIAYIAYKDAVLYIYI